MKTTSNTGAGLGGLAAVACVACCALPVLITAGVVSGGAVAFLAGGMPVIAVVLAAVAAVAFGRAAYRKSRGTGCPSAEAASGGCCGMNGCGCAATRA